MSEGITENNLNLFPDTGHHYFFIQSNGANSVHEYLTESWTRVDTKNPWILARRGKKDGEHGIWVCVETNQGGINRSRFYDEGTEKGEGVAPAESLTPYVSPSKAGELPPCKMNFVEDNVFLNIEWQKEGGQDPLDVDLVVDFGNTRTTALVLENKYEVGREKLVDCCKPLLFLHRGEEFEGESVEERNNENMARKIVDSWFVLREPEFAAREKGLLISRYNVRAEERKTFWGKKKVSVWREEKYMPQMFVEVSPLVLGAECEERLRNADLEKGEFFTMSSPKRFLWDSDVTVGREGNMEWGMLSWKTESKVKPLAGTICRYTYENGKDWDIDHPPFADTVDRPTENPQHPGFPRREAMVWAALSILENAYREITSFKWRERDVRGITRRLKTISLTFPSGWVADELKAYVRAWNRAADIFALTHFENAKASRPEIRLEVDEAVASQLPFVYSEISRLSSDSSVASWIQLFGKGEVVRVMTIDVGGGTMDVSVVEYRDRYAGDCTIAGNHLDYKLLFRDCNTNAGDNAVKCIIERLVLPGIWDCCDSLNGDEEKKEQFKAFWEKVPAQAADREKRSRITKLVFLPISRKWLACLSEQTDKYIKNDEGDCRSIDELVGAEAEEALQDLEAMLKETFGGDDDEAILDRSKPFPGLDRDVMKQCLVDALTPGIAPIADFVAALDVDIVTLSGKITEIPEVQKLVIGRLPLPEQRIVSMKNYMAGNWYPMAKGGRIADAKTVTVVGAALLRAFRNKLIDGWSIRSLAEEKPLPNYWGVMPANKRISGFQGRKHILNPEENESGAFRMLVGGRIGRLATPSQDSRPEQVYELRWKKTELRKKNEENTQVVVVFSRTMNEYGEGLMLKSVHEIESGKDVKDEVELKLCTMERERFWADEGIFSICFKDKQ